MTTIGRSITASKLQDVLNNIGVKPVDRGKIGNVDILVADGFVAPAIINRGWLAKFGVTPGEYPSGCFMTFWFSDTGLSGFGAFDPSHDAGQSAEERKRMRVRSVLDKAQKNYKRQGRFH